MKGLINLFDSQNTLELILNKQSEFQKRFGYSEEMSQEDLVQLIHTHSMFAIEEIFEMLRELPYHKPWKDYSKMSDDEIEKQLKLARKEYIDLIHFVANIGVFLGMTEKDIRNEYLEKNGINIKRQEDPSLGYIH